MRADPLISARPGPVPDADRAASHTLLGVVVREIGAATRHDDHLTVHLADTGEVLRVRIGRASAAGAHRFVGAVSRRTSDGWAALDLDALTALVDAELSARTGVANPEFARQVRASRDAVVALERDRPHRPQRPVAGWRGAYLDSEQSLLRGHPRHPAPKWRSGDPAAWRRYAPEARTAFALRWLAARADVVQEHGAARGGFDACAAVDAVLGGASVPAGFRAVPVHPWQFRLLESDARLRRALDRGVLVDLGEIGAPFHPTASVRTLYQPDADVFLKTGLDVRITNCVRRNAPHELAGAVELTRLLAAPVAETVARHPGFGLLTEPAARTVALDGLDGALGSIARTGLGDHVRPGERVHLAGALAAEHPDPAGTPTRLADLAVGTLDTAAWAHEWWERYTALLVPPVLRLWARHGVVLEPHLQNVLVVVGERGLPVRVLARDLEGTKLVVDGHAPALAALPPAVAAAVGYDAERAWRRVAYCLLVNNLVETAAALADLGAAESALWDVLGGVLAASCVELGSPAPLRGVLAGAPLPAKANLLVRWSRAADRDAGYVPFPNPL